MLNTRLALMGSCRLAVAVAMLAATQIGCGDSTPAPATPPQPAATDAHAADSRRR